MNEPLIYKNGYSNILSNPIYYTGNNFYANTLNLPNDITLDFYLNKHKESSIDLAPNYEINMGMEYDEVVITPATSQSVNPAQISNSFSSSSDTFRNIVLYGKYIYSLNTINSTISQYDYNGNLINSVTINAIEDNYSNLFLNDGNGNIYLAIKNSNVIYKYSSNLILLQTFTIPDYNVGYPVVIQNISIYGNNIFMVTYSNYQGYTLLYKYDLNFNLIWNFSGTYASGYTSFVVINSDTVLWQYTSLTAGNGFFIIQNGLIIQSLVLANPTDIRFIDIGILYDDINEIYYFISENEYNTVYAIYIYDINFNLIRTLSGYSYGYFYPLMAYTLDLNNDLLWFNGNDGNLTKYNYQSDTFTNLITTNFGQAVKVNSSNNIIGTYYNGSVYVVDILKNSPQVISSIPNQNYEQDFTLILSCAEKVGDNNYYRQLLVNTEAPNINLLDVTNSVVNSGVTVTYSNENNLIKAYINFNNYNPTASSLTIPLSNFTASVGIDDMDISPYSPTISSLTTSGLTLNLNGSNILLNGSIKLIGS